MNQEKARLSPWGWAVVIFASLFLIVWIVLWLFYPNLGMRTARGARFEVSEVSEATSYIQISSPTAVPVTDIWPEFSLYCKSCKQPVQIDLGESVHEVMRIHMEKAH